MVVEANVLVKSICSSFLTDLFLLQTKIDFDSLYERYSEVDLKNIAIKLLAEHQHRDFTHINLQQVVDDISKGYLAEAKVPYHNFKHAVDVAQMTHLLIKGKNKIKNFDRFVLIFAALCNDLGHFGVANKDIAAKPGSEFCKNGRNGLKKEFTKFADSHLEFFHTQKALRIIEDNFPERFCERAKEITKLLILATDHSNKDFKNIIERGYKGYLSPKIKDFAREALLCIKVPILELISFYALSQVADLASFFRGDMVIFEKWNARFHAEMKHAEKYATELSTLTADGIEGSEEGFDFKGKNQVQGVQACKHFLSQDIHPKVNNLSSLLKRADADYFSKGIQKILYKNFRRISAECQRKVDKARKEEQAV